ncbi:hypothetical protein [Bacillus thuringiensis]|uniref:hypothetical protein n=1 Tax=Bacillus thuringiensis TaxID=1428 RepID=UPI003339A933
MKNVPRNIKRIFVIMIEIAIGYIIFSFITPPIKPVANQEHTVQLASDQPKVEMSKTAPEKYNGQTRKIA